MNHRTRVLGGVSTVVAALIFLAMTPFVAGGYVSDKEPGTVIRDGRVGAVVPPPGESVTAYVDGLDWDASITVTTKPDGTVIVNPPDDSPTAARIATRSVEGDECTDDYHDTAGNDWESTMNWWFNIDSLPSELGESATIQDLRSGGTNITHEVNECGMDDEIGATATYQGTNHIGVNIADNNNCLTRDSVSQVGFGDLANALGITCNWSVYGGLHQDYVRVESDIRLNKVDYGWTTGSCTGENSDDYYVEGLMTHERGHTWNAVDFPNGHGQQTMGGANGRCPGPDEKSDLGLGDMLAFESEY
jgi:hypothetical protein